MDPHITQANIRRTICQPGYTAAVRHVTEATKKEVMRRYGLPETELSQVEIDHFISLEIGGLNDSANLWPQPMPEARKKDVVETYLKREVCAGRMRLSEAQTIIRYWPAIYQRIHDGK